MQKKSAERMAFLLNDNTMVELANLCNYLKVDFGSYFKDYDCEGQ